jgi:non-ribosomal peptide synthase protein (TIGR01720 family)
MSNTTLRSRIERLSPRQRALLTQRLSQQEPSSNDHNSSRSSKQLAAYILASPNTQSSDLRDFLSARLPNYMVPAHIVVLDALPLTPNGKVDRSALPDPTQARSTTATSVTAPRNEIEATLTAIWSAVLGMEPIAVDDNFFEIGGDSILSIQVVAKARQAGLKLAPAQLFQHQTIAELATSITGPSPAASMPSAPSATAGDLPLTPIQQWFFEQRFAEPQHWNQALLLETPALDHVHLQRAAQALVQHHDALRLTFIQHEGQMQQRVSDGASRISVEYVDLRDAPPDLVPAAIRRHADALQASLKLETGPLIRLAYFDLGQGRTNRLLIVIHHLAVDGASWRIILEDLETAYRHAQHGQTILLSPATTTFRQWAAQIAAYADNSQTRLDLSFWRKHLQADAPELPEDANGPNDEASTCEIVVTLDERETNALLRNLPAAHDIRINEALAAALAHALEQWTGNAAQLIGLEGHGREAVVAGLDLARSVGWFTAFYPAALTWRTQANLLTATQSIARQVREVNARGVSYGTLRYLSPDAAVREELAALPQPQVLLNYLGQFGQMLSGLPLFKPATESPGAAHSPLAQRHHLIEINAAVVDGCLRVVWQYSINRHQHETIQTLADAFAATLRALTAQATRASAAGGTASFAQSGLNELELKDLLAELDE